MSASLAPECNEVKERYDTCFLKWYSEKYLRGQEKDNKECADMFKEYQNCLKVALKDRGVDKLVEEAREENKENDLKHLGPRIHSMLLFRDRTMCKGNQSTRSLPLGWQCPLEPASHFLFASMHPFSILTLGIFVAGYITARWDLVTRLYELAIFAWENGVVTRAAKAFAALSVLFLSICAPTVLLARKETNLHDGLMRVFWPTDIRKSDRPGVVVGWRNSILDVFVVTILEDVDARNTEFHLKAGTLFRSELHPTSQITDMCGHSSMHVLGLSNAIDAAAADPSWFCATTNSDPREPKITCAKAISVQLILYDRPQPQGMQYVSLNPIALALGHDGSLLGDTTVSEGEQETRERQKKEEKRKLAEKLKQHTIFKRVPSARDRALPKIINQINWSWELEKTLHKNVGRLGSRPRRSLSVSERVVETASTMRNYVILQLWTWFTLYLFPTIRKTFVLVLMGHRVVAEMLLLLLEFRAKPGYAALKDISATAQQVEIRLQQFCYWPMQYMTLRQRKNNWASVTTSHPDYIRFYNSLWLVANDVIIGIALGSYIIENADWVAEQIGDLLQTYTVDALQSSISWLMGWPAGLKLNGELAAFLGDLFLWVIDYWSSCIETLTPALPQMVWFIGFSSFAGASMPIAMFSDMLSTLTIHIYSFYLASGRIYHWQLTILQSLFHLFRGKKHNVLRNRIDSCDYDLDQLLVGTILFTLLFFLLPTVAVFYLNFAIARMAIISLKAGFDTLLSCLNHFPLFALMLRIKDPRRLPGGIRFELRDSHDYRHDKANNADGLPPTSVIYLKSIPLTFRIMFNQYFQMANRIRKHYLSPKVFFCLLTGKFVPPINRKNLYSLQYSMLPARRATIWEMWRALNTETKPAKRMPLPYIPPLSNAGRRTSANNGRAR
ncbi:N-acetylglucosaminyl transferase component-domain-containing protein [Fusarium oxysporum f. sp. albedinis]|nr:N-acetylglucosaminyl transferase component-domain-containing protein [Fusarium oxysporum Fo47]KAI3588647.1 N-acetylglucosaminyl transferase component-domain-containing protein [Fusarium oxysporum f. sp. albedinis]WJG34785.1 N-acetylglucosaminyl transferase component-domain-containing protein [Fusarium oxysporum Fo47]